MGHIKSWALLAGKGTVLNFTNTNTDLFVNAINQPHWSNLELVFIAKLLSVCKSVAKFLLRSFLSVWSKANLMLSVCCMCSVCSKCWHTVKPAVVLLGLIQYENRLKSDSGCPDPLLTSHITVSQLLATLDNKQTVVCNCQLGLRTGCSLFLKATDLQFYAVFFSKGHLSSTHLAQAGCGDLQPLEPPYMHRHLPEQHNFPWRFFCVINHRQKVPLLCFANWLDFLGVFLNVQVSQLMGLLPLMVRL